MCAPARKETASGSRPAPRHACAVAIEIDHPKQQPAVQLVRSKPAQPVESSHVVERRLGQKPQKMSVKVPPNGKRGYLARIWTWNEEESGPE